MAAPIPSVGKGTVFLIVGGMVASMILLAVVMRTLRRVELAQATLKDIQEIRGLAEHQPGTDA